MSRSYFWLLHLAMIAAGAYFVADMTNAVIGSRLEASIALPKEAGNPAALPAVASKGQNRDYNAIIEGNIFNSKMRGKKPEATEGEPVVLEIVPPKAPLNQILIGTVAGNGVKSYAVIEDGKSHEQFLYRIGDPVGEDGWVSEISRNKVTVLRGGDTEILETALFPPENKPSPSPPAAPTAPIPTSPSAAGGVRKAGKNRWVMDRREIENAVDNLSQLLTKARLIPNLIDGKPDGFRIFAIMEGSLYAKIGLQNGDILHRVNGIEVKDPQNLLKVFEQLKDESAIAVDLVRNNQKETFSYEIR